MATITKNSDDEMIEIQQTVAKPGLNSYCMALFQTFANGWLVAVLGLTTL